MSHGQPKALFPLANVPVIYYAIQFLALNGVRNIVVATPSEWRVQLKKQVDKLMKDSLFTGRYRNIKVTYFILQDASNLGNTLREINEFESLEEQFLVMYSDIVCNANIEPAIKMHWDAMEEQDRKMRQWKKEMAAEEAREKLRKKKGGDDEEDKKPTASSDDETRIIMTRVFSELPFTNPVRD